MKIHSAYGKYVCEKIDSALPSVRIVERCNCHYTKPTLSQRELEVLALIVQEYSSKQIAAELYISSHTVISHRKNMMEKLGVKTVVGLVKWWCENCEIY